MDTEKYIKSMKFILNRKHSIELPVHTQGTTRTVKSNCTKPAEVEEAGARSRCSDPGVQGSSILWDRRL